MSLRLLSYNIRYGGRGHEAELAEVIRARAPDVVLLQEAIDPEVVKGLAAATEMPHFGSRVGHSTGFLSRRPVTHHAWHRPRRARHPFLEVVLGAGPSQIRLFGLHLSAWFSNWSERRRAVEIRALLEGIREHQHGFHVIAGDFNALAPGALLETGRMPRWIQAMVWLSGRDIARHTIQHMLNSDYADAWARCHPGDPGYTFPVWDPHVRLDYVFAPARDAGRIAACEVVRAPDAAARASDHFPLEVIIGNGDSESGSRG